MYELNSQLNSFRVIFHFITNSYNQNCSSTQKALFLQKIRRVMKIGQDVICINDKFKPEQIALIPNRPVQDKMYTVRDVFTTRNGRALHLDQITNPHLDHPSGLGTFEPSFSVDRFATLVDDEAVVEEEVVEHVNL